MNVIMQLCIKSHTITDSEDVSFTVHQGDRYTTSVPKEDEDEITVFGRYWVPMPKEYFVLSEDE